MYGIIHSALCFSDIERSLTDSSIHHLSYETISNIFESEFPEYSISEISQEAFYIYSGKDTAPEYDKFTHLECPFLAKKEAEL